MLKRMKGESPELFKKAEDLFAPFRLPVSSIRLTATGWGYAGDGGFAGAPALASSPISGLPYNEEIITHIENTLASVEFKDNCKQISEEYFQRYGLVYETQQREISSIENLLKIVSLFEKVGKFSEVDEQIIVSIANIIYFNDGYNRLFNVNETFHAPIKLWLSQYDFIFTTNYDCLLDDACDYSKKVMHLHGGFYYKDKYTRVESLLAPDDACLIWGISSDDKISQMEGGMTFPMQWPLEIPISLFEHYLDILKTADIHRIDIFGYSGENDHHINHAITSNKFLQTITYYCNPKDVYSEVLRFDLADKLKIKSSQKLNLSSWDEIWSHLK